MLVIAHHDVSDPAAFWSAAKELTTKLPATLKIHSVFPSKDLKTGTCVWEGPSASAVQKFLDDNTGKISKNTTYEVDEANAMGVPKVASMAGAAN